MSSKSHPDVFECRIAAEPVYVNRLRELGARGEIALDRYRTVGGELVVVLAEEEVERVRAAGIPLTVGRSLLVPKPKKKPARAPAPMPAMIPTDAPGLVTGFVSEYLDAEEIEARFAAIQADFPAITSWTALPNTTSGYDGSEPTLVGSKTIHYFRINTTPTGPAKPGLLLITGIHAREWVPPLAAIEFAEQLLRNYDPASTDPDVVAVNAMVEGLDILILPALNPDGIDYSHYDYTMWRKNRRPMPAGECPGVDLNRNFSIFWGEAGSSPGSCDDTYRGPLSFSEPETQNVRQLVEMFPNILIGVDCHSFGDTIYRPQPTGGTHTSSEPVDPWDEAIYVQLEAAINAGIGEVSSGKTYTTGTTSNHAGTSDEYLFFGHRIFAFDLECSSWFQPPIAEGLVSAAEVAAAMRHLASATLDLAAEFTVPASVVQTLDRSGSMIASGYVDGTRANARRLVDLLSPEDSLGVVSFSDDAIGELPLTLLGSPQAVMDAQATIDGIGFGGWTSIGAGLQMAGAQLAAASSPRSIILLSDGYQNRPPGVATALAGLPADVRVFTIALGPASDTALLSSIATDTGGEYYFSPDELGLHEIYNYIRSAATTDNLVMNDAFDSGEKSADEPNEDAAEFQVDADAWELTVTASWEHVAADVQIELIAPVRGSLDLRRARIERRDGYFVAKVRRPTAGAWRIRFSTKERTRLVAAAFVRGGPRLELVRPVKPKHPLDIIARVRERGVIVRRLQGMGKVQFPLASPKLLAKFGPLPFVDEPSEEVDDLPEQVRRVIATRKALTVRPGGDPLTYRRIGVPMPHIPWARQLRLNPTPAQIPGSYNVMVRVEGTSERTQTPFVRLGMRTILCPET